jgi:hypothetical protein
LAQENLAAIVAAPLARLVELVDKAARRHG